MVRSIRIPQRFLVLSLLLPLALGRPGAAEETPMTLQSFERTYRQALDDFTREQTPQAAAAVADLEGEGIRYLSCIDLVQEKVHERLPPAALLPVVMLRYAVFLEQMERHQSAQALRSKIVLQRVLGHWVETNDTPDARQAAARLLVPMAFTLDRFQWLPQNAEVRRMPRPGRIGVSSTKTWSPWRWLRHLGGESDAYLGWAVELDPENVAVHHLRAFLAEEKERYDAAVTSLEAIGRIAPDHGEARLRLGINLARVGRRDEAAVRLAETVDGEQEEPWVRIVASEELARLHAAAGRGGEAVALLRRARRTFPENAGLALQLAQQLYRTEAPAAITGELLEGWQGDRGPSPRARYATAPLDDLEANRLRVRRDIEKRLGILAGGLANLDAQRWHQIFQAAPRCEAKGPEDENDFYLYHLVERFISFHRLHSEPEKGRKWLYPPKNPPRAIDSTRRPLSGIGGSP